MRTKLLALMLLAGSSMFAATRVVVGVGGFGGYYAAPPAPVVAYAQAAYPGPGYTWTGGYWYYAGPRRLWHPGYWRAPAFYGGYGYRGGVGFYGRPGYREHWRR